MTTYLVDVNVMFSLISATHEFHGKTSSWFMQTGSKSWRTCPIVENGALRIALNANAFGSKISASQALNAIANIRSIGEHQFVPDDLSILEYRHIFDRLHSRNQVTDAYLLLLSSKIDATFATHDKRILPLASQIPETRVHVI